MKSRVKTRVAFGQPLVNQGTIQQDIALSRYHLQIPRSSMQCKGCASLICSTSTVSEDGVFSIAYVLKLFENNVVASCVVLFVTLLHK